MRKKILVTFALVFCLSFMVSAADSKIEPLGISPGNDLGMAIVQHNCPTFSWTSVDWATGYKLVVFKADSAVLFTYGEISALQTPVLQKTIRGKALAWTPSSIEGLAPGMNYLWYVQAMDEYGTEVWSQGRSFRVELPVIPRGIEEEMKNKLKEYGLNDDNINNVFAGVSPNADPVKANNEPDKVTVAYDGEFETFYGWNAGNGAAGGNYNAFFGPWAGNVMTGNYNVYAGYRAGLSSTSANSNIAIGYYAFANNVTGDYNTIVGRSAGLNTTVDDNCFFGYGTGEANITGTGNSFFGRYAGNDSTAIGNTFMGYYAGALTTSGYDNVYVGFEAGRNGTTARDNTIIGDSAGRAITTGYENTIIGSLAGGAITTGDYNTLVGQDAGDSLTTGNYNTFIGEDAGQSNVTGSGNVFIGSNAGYYVTGSNRLFIDNSTTNSPLIGGDFSANTVKVRGNLTMENTGVVTYFTVDRLDGSTFKLAAGVANAQIGSISNHGVKFTTNNTVKMTLNANGTITMADGGSYNGTWNDASSIEFKENIREISSDEANLALKELNPVIYNYKKFKDEKRAGFIAEHVPEIVATNDRTNLSAMDIVAVLTKVVKEQQETIEALNNRLKKLEEKK